MNPGVKRGHRRNPAPSERKLELAPGERLLDIGCAWGALAEHAARHYGALVLGVTIFPAQFHHARERCRDLPVEIRLQDYQALTARFDKIACVGMFEHVGQGHYRRFFAQVAGLLAADGLLARLRLFDPGFCHFGAILAPGGAVSA